MAKLVLAEAGAQQLTLCPSPQATLGVLTTHRRASSTVSDLRQSKQKQFGNHTLSHPPYSVGHGDQPRLHHGREWRMHELSGFLEAIWRAGDNKALAGLKVCVSLISLFSVPSTIENAELK